MLRAQCSERRLAELEQRLKHTVYLLRCERRGAERTGADMPADVEPDEGPGWPVFSDSSTPSAFILALRPMPITGCVLQINQ